MSENYSEGELSDCRNLSSAQAPSISQRFGRAVEAEYSAPKALHTKEGLLIVNGTELIYNGKKIGDVSDTRKQIVTVGKYIIIYPDKLFYDTDSGEFGSMDITYTSAAKKAVFTNNSVTVAGAKWKFRVGDAVDISGCTSLPYNNKNIICRGVDGDTLTFYDNSFKEGTEASAVSFKRVAPDLDFICENNYRLWGAKGDTIYSSKYNDPFNFQVFDGLSGDSYNIYIGTDGEWTGCVPYSSHVCFFKENVLHKIYGDKPSNFQVVTSQVYGVQAGSERSICTVNETVLYKGVGGIYAYTGGIPELISGAFGTERFSDACATSDGERYYISMRNGDQWGLYVYDLLKGVWLKEDECQCVDMAFYDGDVYFLRADGQLLKTGLEIEESDIEWSATFCPFNETMNERKGYSKFHLRLELGAKSWLNVEIKRDTDTRWKKVYTTHNERHRTVSIPVMPARCDSVEIRLSGKGECKIRGFIREFFTGSDV